MRLKRLRSSRLQVTRDSQIVRFCALVVIGWLASLRASTANRIYFGGDRYIHIQEYWLRTLARKSNTVMSRARKAQGPSRRVLFYIQEGQPRS